MNEAKTGRAGAGRTRLAVGLLAPVGMGANGMRRACHSARPPTPTAESGFDAAILTIQGVYSIDILDSLNPSLTHFSIQCLPKHVLNLVLNPSLNPSFKC